MRLLEQTYEMTKITPPEMPPEIPFKPSQSAGFAPPVPIVYEDSPARMEYRVLARNSLKATALEADLNVLGREGWSLAQILPQEEQVLLVLMRWARSD
jgi:hypothetical protein